MYFLKFSPDCRPRPPETTILAAVSSGRSDFWNLGLLETREADGCWRRDGFDGGRSAVADRLERGGADGDDFLLVARLHRLDGVAGVDRALEGVGRHHLDDVGDLHHVERGATRGMKFLPDAVEATTSAS